MSEDNPSYRIILIIIVAIVIAAGTVGGYVWVNWVPTPYKGQVLGVNFYPIHHEFTQPTTTEGVGGQAETYDEMLVFADVSVKNVSKSPLYIQDIWAVVNLPGESDRSDAASVSDFDKVFIAYPDTKSFQKPPLHRNVTIQPGQQVEGEVVFNYQLPQAKWDTRTGLDISIGFGNQGAMVMHVNR